MLSNALEKSLNFKVTVECTISLYLSLFCINYIASLYSGPRIILDRGLFTKGRKEPSTCDVANRLRWTSHVRYDLFTKRVAKFAYSRTCMRRRIFIHLRC